MAREPLKALVLDFDSTISTPTYVKRAGCWAVADNVALFQSMSKAEIVQNFGGAARIATLSALLEACLDAGVRLHIVSIGYRTALMPHLAAAGLGRFFDDGRIFGQDSPRLKQVGFVKGRLIKQLMAAEGWQHGDVLFVDDSNEHIERASSVCQTLLVSPASKSSVGGMADVELNAIRQLAGLPPAAAAAATVAAG